MIYKKENIKYIIFVICFYILIFQNLIQENITIFKYFDEFLALISLFYLFSNLIKKCNKNKEDNKYLKIIALFLGIIVLLGLLSNVIYKIQPINVYVSDVLLFMKFFLAIYLSKKIITVDFIEKNKKNILLHINIVVFILLVLTICNYIFKIWPFDERYGIMANRLFYTHPTYLAAICTFLYASTIAIKKKTKTVQGVILIFVLLTTLRMKAIGTAIVCIFLTLYIERSNKKISIIKIAILGFLIFILAYEQIMYYFFQNEEFARAMLMNKSIDIAKEYFPLGAGFGTFGSYLSGENYSPLYYKYNLNNVWGLQNGNAWFVSDTFWPMIIGQFGFIGFLCYILVLIYMFKCIQNEYSLENKYLYCAKIVCFLYLLISSFAESAFVNPMAIPFGLLIGIEVRKKENKE